MHIYLFNVQNKNIRPDGSGPEGHMGGFPSVLCNQGYESFPAKDSCLGSRVALSLWLSVCLPVSLYLSFYSPRRLPSTRVLCVYLISPPLLYFLPFNWLTIIEALKWLLAFVYLLTLYWLPWLKNRQEKNLTKVNCFIFKLTLNVLIGKIWGGGEI